MDVWERSRRAIDKFFNRANLFAVGEALGLWYLDFDLLYKDLVFWPLVFELGEKFFCNSVKISAYQGLNPRITFRHDDLRMT